MHSLAFHFRVGVSTVHCIVVETCKVMWEVLQPLVMPVPTGEMWKKTAEEFWTRWNFPLCIGAIDGKHCRIKKPNNSGSKYFNYKGYFSIVLLAVVDASCKFMIVDVGSCGGNSDGGIFERSLFGQKLTNDTLNVPQMGVLPGTDKTVPFVFIADDAFPLRHNIMKPFCHRDVTYVKEIYNYRLSRARGVVEMAFGQLAQMWRILLHQMEVQPEVATDIVKALTVLHNFIKIREPSRSLLKEDTLEDARPIESTQTFNSIERPRYRASQRALQVRETFMNYFMSQEGTVTWQDKHVFSKP